MAESYRKRKRHESWDQYIVSVNSSQFKGMSSKAKKAFNSIIQEAFKNIAQCGFEACIQSKSKTLRANDIYTATKLCYTPGLSKVMINKAQTAVAAYEKL